jgi:hypothetical protein
VLLCVARLEVQLVVEIRNHLFGFLKMRSECFGGTPVQRKAVVLALFLDPNTEAVFFEETESDRAIAGVGSIASI